jgi:hypothetical protein
MTMDRYFLSITTRHQLEDNRLLNEQGRNTKLELKIQRLEGKLTSCGKEKDEVIQERIEKVCQCILENEAQF